MVLLPKNLREIHKLGEATSEWLVRPREVEAFRQHHIRVLGYTKARTGYRFVRHRPDFAQILVCTEGMGWVWVDNGWKRCGPGQAYVNAPESGAAYYVPRGGRWKIGWVIYDPLRDWAGWEPGTPPRLVSMDARGLLWAIEGLCHEAAGAADPHCLGLLTGLVHRFVQRTLRTETRDQRLGALWQGVRQRIAEPWTLGGLARLAGMSEETLRRRMKQELRISPMAHLTKLRMEVAADRLVTTRESIASIAERSGYEDPFAFSHAFKRQWGQCPSRYRKSTAGVPLSPPTPPLRGAGIRTSRKFKKAR